MFFCLFMILMFSPSFQSITLCYSWFLRSPEPCSWCNFPLFHLIAYIFFPFICLPVSFIFFPLQKLRSYYFFSCFSFLLYAVISPFYLILFFPFFPFTSPSLHCLLPLVNGQSLSFATIHYFFWLPGRQTGNAVGVSSAYNYLYREENVLSTGTVTYRKLKGYLHSWVVLYWKACMLTIPSCSPALRWLLNFSSLLKSPQCQHWGIINPFWSPF